VNGYTFQQCPQRTFKKSAAQFNSRKHIIIKH